MATYQLVGSQDPASRIDRVQVESATEENPEGKVLVLDGEPQELSDEQYATLSRFVKLEPVKASEQAQVQFVDQPGVEMPSLSTDVPPNLGTAPDVSRLSKDDAKAHVERIQGEGQLLDVDTSSANRDELRKALGAYYGQEV